MKIGKLLALALVLIMALAAAACGGTETTPTEGSTPDKTGEADKPLKIALMLNGTLGDRSFFDSANNGMEMVKKELKNVETKVVEMTYDDTKWEPAIMDILDEGHDIIITGTWQMQEIISRIAPDHPDQKFIVYDTSMDYSDGKYPNVYSIEYKQNDGSYLAGILAASMSQSGQIGFVGGMDNTVIYDFLVGYIQGAKEINPNVKVASSFVGNFHDAARAKELAMSQYNLGADIIFSCASTAGDGTMQAGKELDKLVIGVDSDQAMLYKEQDPEMAGHIPSSMLKRVDISLFQAIKAAQKGELAYGTRVAVGIPEDGVGLAENEFYESIVPKEVRDTIASYVDKIKKGEIEIVSAFTMENDELLKYVDDAK
ncbi:MAG TPA: BMP family ABC transporter substrate-binding protein [Bacillota bacterium]|nr:BMP family ABC transporter substrate-binding protein [Bacillota bacterium]